MKLKVSKVQLHDIKAGNMAVLKKVVDETYETYFNHLLKSKEDTRLFQGYCQALLALKEVLS